MTTDEEKSRIQKLLKDLEVPEVKLTERCSDLVNDFREKFAKEVDDEEGDLVMEAMENPYRIDPTLLEDIERKLASLLAQGKRAKRDQKEIASDVTDPKRPWRTNSSKEKLLRIDNELKRHHEKASQKIDPLTEDEMTQLVKECEEDAKDLPSPSPVTMRDVVDAAKKNLPNFQYRKIENSTATDILPTAHVITPSDVENPLKIEIPDARDVENVLTENSD